MGSSRADPASFMYRPLLCVDMSSIDAPPAAPCLRPSVAPFDIRDLLPFELPVLASVEVCSVNSSVTTYTRAAEGIPTTEVPPKTPRFGPSHPPFDLGLLPAFDLPASWELPHTSETSNVKPAPTSSRLAISVPMGRSAHCPSFVEKHHILPVAPALKPVAFASGINLGEMPSLELPPPALGPSGDPHLEPFADPFDFEDSFSLELPLAIPETPPLAPAGSPSSCEPPSDEENALETTGCGDTVLWFGLDQDVPSFDELPNFRSTVAVERHGGFMSRGAASMPGRSSLRRLALRADKTALQQMTDSRSDFCFSWGTFPFSLKREREVSPSAVSTSASEFHDDMFQRAIIGSNSDGRSR
eukprot:TRINITY_DN19301_c0_g2_i1.p1 TRINITY_DN19301_c0_g2~~TRINITY_DN19301_c0_g2_i1.p1  ORF type:complete len:358 (-),score=51.96 TRINITY_DN19301_c0_g2_i1:168-1241(-)